MQFDNDEVNNFANINYQSFLEYFASLSGVEYIIITSILALLITENINTTYQNSLGNFFMQLGQNIITITGQDLTRHQHAPTIENIKDIRKEIEEIKRRLNI